MEIKEVEVEVEKVRNKTNENVRKTGHKCIGQQRVLVICDSTKRKTRANKTIIKLIKNTSSLIKIKFNIVGFRIASYVKVIV
jgi:hypothetical protein